MTSVKTNAQYDKEIEKLNAELNQCLVDAGGDPIASGDCSRVYQEKVEALIPAGTKYNTDDFSLVTEISFASVDATGTIHSFSDVQVGEIIDLLSEDGGYMVAEITKAPTGLWYEDHKIGVKVTSFKGKASGRCRIKVFSISEDLDPQEFDNFVRKSGDTITGTLTVEPVGNVPSLGVHPSKDASSGKYVIYTHNKNNEFAFFVTAAGNVGVSSSWSPTRDYYLAPKKYVDDTIKADKKPAGFDFNYKSMTDGKNIEEAKSIARVDGQFSYYGANSEYYLFINRFDYYKRVNISPYYDDGTAFTVDDNSVEDLSVPPGAVTTAEGEIFIDYLGLGMRQFLSVYKKSNDKYSLGRIYYITGVTFYKNEPFIRAKLSTWRSLETIYYGLNHLHLPGII